MNYCKDLSVIKLVFFAYLVNKNRYFEKSVYTANNTVDIVAKEISTISGDFSGFVNAIPFILRGIDILKRRGIVDVAENLVHLINDDYQAVYKNGLSNFEKKAIDTCVTWSDKRFIKEVLHCV